MTANSKLHPRNQHREGYDFEHLIGYSPELEAFCLPGLAGRTTIDFADQQAVRALNRALLKAHYRIPFWDIPANYLCPPIPGRVDYVHYLADLLAADHGKEIPRGRKVKVLDIGTGANLVYPLTGQYEYGWHFSAVDIDPAAINVAKQICQFNKLKIDLRLQSRPENIFTGAIKPADRFHLSLCNPPFHSSSEAASEGTARKWKNLGKSPSHKLNFGGQEAELWCPGGEVAFISTMIEQSVVFAKQCLWFTSLVSKRDHLLTVHKLLEKAGAIEVKTIDMAQGQKISRFVAWTFIKKSQRLI
jgi:23S rRNA (adenine1618-N6)-methyltransferase